MLFTTLMFAMVLQHSYALPQDTHFGGYKPMFSFIFRALAWFILAGGVIIAVVDATRSVAAKQLELTRVGETIAAYMPKLAEKLAKAKLDLITEKTNDGPLANVIDFLNSIPVALLAAVLFLLIYALASRNSDTRYY